MLIEGPIVAAVTHFKKRGGICYEAVLAYLDFLTKKGVTNIIVNGTTGEFASLTFRERKSMLEFCRAHFKGTIVNHVSACSIKDVAGLLRHSEKFADAALLLPPFYYADAPMPGIIEFFEEVLKACNMPLFLYNFPCHCGIKIEPQMLAELVSKHECIAGIKDSSGDIRNALDYKSVDPDLQVFVGSDKAVLEVLENGLDGSVTGGGNPIPECLVGIHACAKRGDRAQAQRLQNIFNLWTDFRRSISSNEISAAKAGLHARMNGFPIWTRPPLLHETKQNLESISDKLHKEILGDLKEFEGKQGKEGKA
jgi:dihydrodipicolinate synthase/N-acetylneuraminate lyase